MTSNSKKTLPLYRVVADKLIASIISGKYPIDTVLPSEMELAEMHSISRHTAREAMKILEQAGLITRRRRAGSVVVANEPPQRYNQRIQSVNDLLQYGNASRLRVIDSNEVVLNTQIAELLRIKEGSVGVQLKGIRFQRHDKRPFAYSEIYMNPTGKVQRDRLHDLDKALAYLLKKLDVPNLKSIEQTLVAENATPELAGILAIRDNAAMLKSIRTYIDNDGKPIAAALSWHPGDLFNYSTTLTKS